MMTQNGPSDAATLETIDTILAGSAAEPGALLPTLHAIQDAVGYIPGDAVPQIASAFNLSRAEIHGVITFYHHFRSSAPAAHTIQVCRAESCQSMGADRLLAHAEKALGCRLHERSADGAFALEPVYCLGQCATSPAIMIDDAVYARVSTDKFDRLLDKTKEPA